MQRHTLHLVGGRLAANQSSRPQRRRPLRSRESSRRQNLLIRLQQDLFGRFSYHTNLLAGLGGPESEAIEEGRRRRVPFHGHIERTGVRIAPPSANLQRTGLTNAMGDGAYMLVAATIEM